MSLMAELGVEGPSPAKKEPPKLPVLHRFCLAIYIRIYIVSTLREVLKSLWIFLVFFFSGSS